MAKPKKSDDEKAPIIIIKKIKKQEAGHHGGSWKVAYADFVTAMMAFFLLLWLLSVTSPIQKKKIADYFSPQMISRSVNGAGGFLSGTTISQEGAMTETVESLDQNTTTEAEDVKIKKDNEEFDKQDEKAFKATEEIIRQAVENTPDLKELAKNLLIDMTPEGLRIQIVDQEGKPMFELGKATPLPPAVKLLTLITGAVKDLPNRISIRGHTDSKQYGKDAEYSNWELSADRSNASRRVMLGAGLDGFRIENVQGKADQELFVPADPNDARNRRITLLLLKRSLVSAAKRTEENFIRKQKSGTTQKPEPKKREDGVIYFP